MVLARETGRSELLPERHPCHRRARPIFSRSGYLRLWNNPSLDAQFLSVSGIVAALVAPPSVFAATNRRGKIRRKIFRALSAPRRGCQVGLNSTGSISVLVTTEAGGGCKVGEFCGLGHDWCPQGYSPRKAPLGPEDRQQEGVMSRWPFLRVWSQETTYPGVTALVEPTGMMGVGGAQDGWEGAHHCSPGQWRSRSGPSWPRSSPSHASSWGSGGHGHGAQGRQQKLPAWPPRLL